MFSIFKFYLIIENLKVNEKSSVNKKMGKWRRK